MKQNDFQNFNRKGWYELIKNNKEFSNTSLPEYGPFMPNEKELKLFTDVKGKKVLELGCASGKSLKYLSNSGAQEVWGIDISEEQINKAKELKINNSFFFVSPMEKNPGLPLDYFDYVLSLYSIGFSSNPIDTIKLSCSYLKQGGKFILSWTHPFFNCLGIEDNKLIINHSYNDENATIITKGPDKIELLQYNLKISTLINELISLGMEIDKLIEQNPTEINGIGSYQSPYFDKRKLVASPTTLIIVAHKK